MRPFREFTVGSSCGSCSPLTARFPALVGAPEDAADRFGELDLAVVGAGSVGGVTADLLARLAPRSMVLVDRGEYRPTSPWTHSGVGRDAVGRKKAHHLARRLSLASPETRVFAFAGAYEDLPRGALFSGGIDAAFLAGDNLALEITLGQDCLRFGVPLYHASVHGETLTAHCRVFSMRRGAAGACPSCGIGGKGEWDRVGRDAVFSCDPGGRAARVPVPGRPPTRSLAFVCATAANMAVGAFVRRVLGLERAPEDCCFEYRGYTHQTTITRLERREDCPVEHGSWSLVVLPAGLAMESLDELLGAAGEALTDATVSVEGYRFATEGICGCGEGVPLRRFVRPGRSGPVCRRCGERVLPHPFYSASRVPGEWLEPVRHRRLRSLGAYSVPSVLVRRDGHAVLIKGGADVQLGK
jgi:molybdopterin/thiamine biosynthesis adenylyltransferase